MLRELGRAAACLAVIGVASASVAAPVTYQVVSGSITTIQLFALSGTVQPCPIGGSTNCLANAPLSIDLGSITIDESALLLANATPTASGTGSISLGGLLGNTSVSFSSTPFQRGGPSFLGGGGGSYTFDAPGAITTNLVVNTLGGPVALPGTVFPSALTGTINVSGNRLVLNLQGVNLGMLCDPLDPTSCAVVKADFHLQATNPIPEPTAALVFGLGVLLFAASARRLRKA
jgi:hypothetical protein